MSELGKWLELPWLPVGTIVNVLAILLFGIAGLWLSKQIPDETQKTIRKYLAMLTFLVGGWMIASGMTDGWRGTKSFWQFLGLGGITLLAVSFGNLIGTWLKLQERLNNLGKAAKERFAKLNNDESATFSDGFVTCTILFTVGPISFLGAVEDGLGTIPRILLLKSLLDGIAVLCFAPRFGAGVLLSVVPVLAYQGTVTLLASHLNFMKEGDLLHASFNLIGGMLVLTIVLVILETQKVPLANYLPALAIGPALTHWWLV